MNDHVSDSEDIEDSEVDLLGADHLVRTPPLKANSREQSQPESILSHRFRKAPPKPSPKPSESRKTQGRNPGAREAKIAVMVPPPSRPWEYKPFKGATTVDSVLDEYEGLDGDIWYKVEFEDGKKQEVSFDNLLKLPNGQNALKFYQTEDDINSVENSRGYDRSSAEASMSSFMGKRTRAKRANDSYVDISKVNLSSEDRVRSEDTSAPKKRRLRGGRISIVSNNNSRKTSRASSNVKSRPASRFAINEDSSDSESLAHIGHGNYPTRRVRTRASSRPSNILSYGFFPDEDSSSSDSLLSIRAGQQSRKSLSRNRTSTRLRNKAMQDDDVDELAGEGQLESDDSEIVTAKQRRSKNPAKGQQGKTLLKAKPGRPRRISLSPSPGRQQPTRRSARGREVRSMRERDIDEEIYADDISENRDPKVISIREIYQPVPENSQFAQFHNKQCDTCGIIGNDSSKGILIYCQGCSCAMHKNCLGYRSNREALVTKIGHENFVMQCRRCTGLATRKDNLAPTLDTCQKCQQPGASCAPFSLRKTIKQEEKIRQENGGDDPVTVVSSNLINNPDNILFRCTSCRRSWHFEHLPPLSLTTVSLNDISEVRTERCRAYSRRWNCKDCRETKDKIQTLVAWRLRRRDLYVDGHTVNMFGEDTKEYLIKWENRSFFACSWMPGAWVWGVAHTAMRKSFFEKNPFPKWTAEEAIPEEFLRMEIIFDVTYDDSYDRPRSRRSEESDKAHIGNVREVYVKFQGLSYDEAVWQEPPLKDETERWADFVAAYNEYLAGKYFKPLSKVGMKDRITKFRSLKFEKEIELKSQPKSLVGSLMPYQLDGLNWLLYNYYKEKNVILADEMGLGKTIQIIALLASLANDKPKCSPFLVVTPNSTCLNWRREIKKWAPSLRVVAYYGPKSARKMAMDFELFPDGSADMKADVVVTSYEAPVDEYSRSFFKKIKWAGMIVDEGQRLKNDENLLYGALKALKTPFQVLLTGTPLQNNKRELFNLLQFLDPSMDAAELDEKYDELTKENLPELHDLIRPFFLRRTKLQVLKFLPPMAQVILPVTMSIVQKKLYKSILARNPDLIKSIFAPDKTIVRPSERGNLNNILMQLRKCLCHPFIYSTAIEERTLDDKALHRNLIDASSKFQLLEIMLPKLRERGHRVLLFSQFLDQLDLIEDFLTGLELPFERLDGKIGSLEKQKRIDAFNAPDSHLFAFLLSTRAGGVGINLATADTVIIMDPDFNPKQDLQALSRAHRIGQKKKVLCFQLMTKDSVEEKIVQIGRKKMALDQALIESLDAEDDAGVDLESILRHGAEALFNDDSQNDIHYDSTSVDKLLDRTQVENADAEEDKTAESQFSFARVWANDKGDLTEDVGDAELEPAATENPSLWSKILEQRQLDAEREAAKNLQTFGRGKRARQTIDYHKAIVDNDPDDDDDLSSSPHGRKSKRRSKDSDNDIDFAGAAGESDGDDDSEANALVEADIRSLQPQQNRLKGILGSSREESSSKYNGDLTEHPVQQNPQNHRPNNLYPSPEQYPPEGSRRTFLPESSQHYPPILPPQYSRQTVAEYQQPTTDTPKGNGTSRYQQPFGPRHFSNPAQFNQYRTGPGEISGKAEILGVQYDDRHIASTVVPGQENHNDSRGRNVLHHVPRNPSHKGFKSQPRKKRGSEASHCQACNSVHLTGQCPLKLIGAQRCGLCGLAHFGVSRACPHLASEVQIRLMLDALRFSKEFPTDIAAAKALLTNELIKRAQKKHQRVQH